MSFVLKICASEWKNASRDKRELSVYKEMGTDVAGLAKGNVDDAGRLDEVDGFKVYRYSTRPLGSKIPNALNRIVSIFTWAYFAKKMQPDIISGHDLSGLTIGWMGSLLMRKKVKLIYDSHEFELGRNVKRRKVALTLVKWWEGFLMKRCVFSIMVNDTIADEVMRIHNLKNRPIVIRSTPNLWNIDNDECLRTRTELFNEFGRGGKAHGKR